MKRIALVLLALMMVGCAGPYAVKHATATDWVWGVEDRENGYTVIWMRYDSYGAYCTTDKAMVDEAQHLRDGNILATFEYATINEGDPDHTQLFSNSGCPDESESHKTFRLINIRPATGR